MELRKRLSSVGLMLAGCIVVAVGVTLGPLGGDVDGIGEGVLFGTLLLVLLLPAAALSLAVRGAPLFWIAVAGLPVALGVGLILAWNSRGDGQAGMALLFALWISLPIALTMLIVDRWRGHDDALVEHSGHSWRRAS